MRKIDAPRLPRRLGLAIGFGLALVSTASLVGQGLGVSNVPLPIVAAVAEVVGVLVLARIIWDYHSELGVHSQTEARRLRVSALLGGAAMVWMQPKLTVDERVTVSDTILGLLTDAFGAGEAAGFYYAVKTDVAEKYLLDLVQRLPSLKIAASFKAEPVEARLEPFVRIATPQHDT
jgi:hypothetical protein